MSKKYDIAVIGAGFGGSLTAMILHKLGYRVVLMEKGSHPRFAIGESSTPIADMILRDLAQNYDLPWLRHFSRYGSWQQHHPEIVCGIKRGFSYFKHSPHERYSTDAQHSRELLVAASANDEQSDTNWLRSDFDAYLANKVIEMGITYYDQTEITKVLRSGSTWNISAQGRASTVQLNASWMVDATGNSRLLAQNLGITSETRGFHTNSYAVYSHFNHITPWSEMLEFWNIDQSDYPFNPDHAALHHLLDEGWMWMLRFNNDLTSCGIVFNANRKKMPESTKPAALWQQTLDKYPSLAVLLKRATMANPPGQLYMSRRLQRRLLRGSGEGWVALPHTIGFIDPLHSTGIAHTLSGVERIAHYFKLYGRQEDQLTKHLKGYEEAVFNELRFIDLLVGGCHNTTHHMELFTLYSMLYFTAAITYEQNRLNGRFDIEQHQFMSANHPVIPSFVASRCSDLRKILQQEVPNRGDFVALKKQIAQDIEPYNIANLLRPEIPNMYRHTTVEM